MFSRFLKSWLRCWLLMLVCSVRSQAEELIRAGIDKVQFLSPYRIQGFSDRDILTDAFEGLVVFEPGPKVVGGAAERWRISAGGTFCEFWIREEACWSDGRPLLAEDFVRSWNQLCRDGVGFFQQERLRRFLANRVPLENGLKIFEGDSEATLGVWAAEPKKLCFKLESSVNEDLLLQCLADAFFFPLPEGHLERVERWSKNSSLEAQVADPMVSNGNYCIRAWRPGTRLILKANPRYWKLLKGQSAPYFKSVIYNLQQSEMGLLSDFQSGQLDFFSCSGFQNLSALEKWKDQTYWVPQAAFKVLVFNGWKPQFESRELREVLNLLLDRQFLQKANLPGIQEISYGLLPPSRYPRCALAPAYFDLSLKEKQALAAHQLEALGYTAEKPLRVEVLVQFEDVITLHAIAALLNSIPQLQVGFAVPERKVCTQWVREHKPELFLSGFSVCPTWNPAVYHELNGPSIHPSFKPTLSHCRSEAYRAALKRVYECTPSSEKEWEDWLLELETCLLQEMPCLPLAHLACAYVASEGLEGLPTLAAYPAATVPSAWLSRRRSLLKEEEGLELTSASIDGEAKSVPAPKARC